MKDEGTSVTINDVALAAGVSKGTVDRVIHNRGQVSKKSKEKILKVIEELGYKPNFYASLLASQKERLIQCVIPEYQQGDFWALTAKGIDDARSKVSRFGIRLEIVSYNQYDLESFQKVCGKILENPPSAVLVAPVFGDQTKRLIDGLNERGVPYIFLDSKIDDDNYLAYFGMPMYDSGYLCADILTGGRDVPDKILVVRISRDKMGLSDPTASRREGFMDYMKEYYPDVIIENVFINPQDPVSIDESLAAALASGNEKKFIVMFNSRIHLLADFLERKNIKNCRVIGFDALDKNLESLRRNTVFALIAQHTDRQTAEAVNAMTDYLIFGTRPAKRDNFTQMDILIKNNCNYYL